MGTMDDYHHTRPWARLVQTILLWSLFLSTGDSLPAMSVPGPALAERAVSKGRNATLMKRVTSQDQLDTSVTALATSGWSYLTQVMLEDVAGMEALVSQRTGKTDPRHFQTDFDPWIASQTRSFNENWQLTYPYLDPARWKKPLRDFLVSLDVPETNPQRKVSVAPRPHGPNHFEKLEQSKQWKMVNKEAPQPLKTTLQPTHAHYDIIFNVPDGVVTILDAQSFKEAAEGAYQADFDQANEERRHPPKGKIAIKNIPWEIDLALPTHHSSQVFISHAWRVANKMHLDQDLRITSQRHQGKHMRDPSSPLKHLNYVALQSVKMRQESADLLKRLLQRSCGGEGVVPIYPAEQRWRIGSFQFSTMLELVEFNFLPWLLAERKTLLGHRALTSVTIFRCDNEDRPTLVWSIERVTPDLMTAANQRKEASERGSLATTQAIEAYPVAGPSNTQAGSQQGSQRGKASAGSGSSQPQQQPHNSHNRPVPAPGGTQSQSRPQSPQGQSVSAQSDPQPETKSPDGSSLFRPQRLESGCPSGQGFPEYVALEDMMFRPNQDPSYPNPPTPGNTPPGSRPAFEFGDSLPDYGQEVPDDGQPESSRHPGQQSAQGQSASIGSGGGGDPMDIDSDEDLYSRK